MSTRSGESSASTSTPATPLWAYAWARRIVAQPIVARGWVYATTDDGTVVALEVGDATLDGWHMWGGSPGHNGSVGAQKL